MKVRIVERAEEEVPLAAPAFQEVDMDAVRKGAGRVRRADFGQESEGDGQPAGPQEEPRGDRQRGGAECKTAAGGGTHRDLPRSGLRGLQRLKRRMFFQRVTRLHPSSSAALPRCPPV